MTQVYIGNLDSRVTEKELEDAFCAFGIIRNLWIARNPPGFAFVDFADSRDAQDAVRELDGKNGWKVQLSRRTRGDGRGRLGRAGFESKCYECGEPGHYARLCRNRGGARRNRSRTPPRYRRSPSYRRSPRGRSPRRRSVSPRRRSYNRSPPYRGRHEDDKHANGNGLRKRRRSGS